MFKSVKVALLTVLVLGATASCQHHSASIPDADAKRPTPAYDDSQIPIRADDPEIAKAKAKAQASLDTFISGLTKKTKEIDYDVKFPLPVKGETEHIWLYVSSYKDGVFSGVLANDSFYDSTLVTGTAMKVKRADVEDWSILFPDGKMQGGFSVDIVDAHR